MSKGKEDEKEKEKTMETSTIPSSEVFTFVKKQLEDIGFELLELDPIASYLAKFMGLKLLELGPIKYNYIVREYLTPSPISVKSGDLSKLIEILKSPGGKYVTGLNLSDRTIKKYLLSELKDFIGKLKDTSITTLSLTIADLEDEATAYLAERLKDTNITKLDLTTNLIGNEGATALADAIKQGGSKITALYLNNNNIGDKGTKALADAIKQGGSKITALCLNNNNIGDKGTKALDGLKDIIAEVIYDSQHPSTTITSSTTSTTTTSLSTTSSLEKCFTSASFSSTSEPKTTPAVTTTALPLGGDPIDGESMSPTVTTLRTVTTSATYHSSTILFSPLDPATADPSPELTGQNTTTDVE